MRSGRDSGPAANWSRGGIRSGAHDPERVEEEADRARARASNSRRSSLWARSTGLAVAPGSGRSSSGTAMAITASDARRRGERDQAAAPEPVGVRPAQQQPAARQPAPTHTAAKPAATAGGWVMKAGASDEIGQEGDQYSSSRDEPSRSPTSSRPCCASARNAHFGDAARGEQPAGGAHRGEGRARLVEPRDGDPEEEQRGDQRTANRGGAAPPEVKGADGHEQRHEDERHLDRGAAVARHPATACRRGRAARAGAPGRRRRRRTPDRRAGRVPRSRSTPIASDAAGRRPRTGAASPRSTWWNTIHPATLSTTGAVSRTRTRSRRAGDAGRSGHQTRIAAIRPSAATISAYLLLSHGRTPRQAPQASARPAWDTSPPGRVSSTYAAMAASAAGTSG